MAEHVAKVFYFILEFCSAELVGNVQHEWLRLVFGRSAQVIGRRLESLVRVPAGGNVIVRVS